MLQAEKSTKPPKRERNLYVKREGGPLFLSVDGKLWSTDFKPEEVRAAKHLKLESGDIMIAT